jgi:hypothetical protein
MKILIFTLAFACISVFSLSAQSSSLASISNNASQQILDSEDWSFYADKESMVLFIDFEKIKVNLSDITVKNHSGEVVFREEVWQLPVNTIFEINYAGFKSGLYQVEIRSFTGILKKELIVQ